MSQGEGEEKEMKHTLAFHAEGKKISRGKTVQVKLTVIGLSS